MKMIAFALVFVLLSSCITTDRLAVSERVEEAIERFTEEYDIKDYSYLLAQDTSIISEEIGNDDDVTVEVKSIVEYFCAPLFIKYLVANSFLSEDSFVNSPLVTPGISTLSVKDLYRTDAHHGELLKDRKAYARLLLEFITKHSSLTQFYKFISDEVGIALPGIKTSKDLIKALTKISTYQDGNLSKENPTYRDTIPTIDHTWYTHNVLYLAGWNVLTFEHQTILWSVLEVAGKDIVLLKFLNKGLLVTLVYNQEKESRLFKHTISDVLQSPVAVAILKSIYIPTYRDAVDFSEDKSVLSKQLDIVLSNPYNFLFLKEWQIKADYYEKIGNKEHSKMLQDLYQEKFNKKLPMAYFNKTLVAGFNYVSNNFNGTQFFKVAKKSEVEIFCSGQVKENDEPDDNNYQYDNVELFLDIFNNKMEHPDTSYGHSFYRFNYHHNKVTGNGSSNQGIEYAFDDPNDSTYTMEVRIPWSTLHRYAPKTGNKIGLSAFVGNSGMEENKRESVLSWSVGKLMYWNVPKQYGSLILTGAKSVENTSHAGGILYSHQILVPPRIDGISDDVWNNVESVPLTKLIEKLDPRIKPPQASFKTVWDEHYLYFMFKVFDNTKNVPKYLTVDRGWIEDASTGKIIWKLNSRPNMNCFPTTITTSRIILPKGEYILRYTSDESHSFEAWYSKTPPLDYYGLLVYEHEDFK